MKIRGFVMLSVVGVLTGCQTAEPRSDVETQAQIAAAIPTNYRQEALTFLHGSLPEPSSLQGAEISAPMVAPVGPSSGGEAPIVCVRLNSQDASGSVTGIETLALIFRDGRVINSTPGGTPCSNAVYGPVFDPRAPA